MPEIVPYVPNRPQTPRQKAAAALARARKWRAANPPKITREQIVGLLMNGFKVKP